MPKDTTDLAALIGSRICHDLISPIGAISNGLELMSMGGTDSTSPEMQLINDSCVSAAARIRFFRIAFGSAGDAQRISQREVLAVLRDLDAGSRVKTDWQVTGDLPRHEVQLAFLVLMCIESTMPRGGSVVVHWSDGRFRIEGTSPRLTIQPELWSVLTDNAEDVEISPAMVQFALLRVLLRDTERTLACHPEDDRLLVVV
ncbi:histidine phosphotransferase family protein [Puniceibacterium sp. IMCC21224]|uniref:histidine phosphotransferase family protein n=1 Tax=Puniceibacterium sp. IMCC21224 TaxID=1618204 RepID=UPI00064DF151|nr:histidine phosphotransferase family protein [Puniceibacterium sp. IMCC21224]KMK66853.1 hypothetical protein IMCC21224_111711 [Puniceibacterium sp. IMCC21224]